MISNQNSIAAKILVRDKSMLGEPAFLYANITMRAPVVFSLEDHVS